MKEEISEDLAKATIAVATSKDLDLFVDFLNKFKDEEANHINENLTGQEPNLRLAALCAEAFGTASLLISLLSIKELDKD
jgi:hypothetical protein